MKRAQRTPRLRSTVCGSHKQLYHVGVEPTFLVESDVVTASTNTLFVQLDITTQVLEFYRLRNICTKTNRPAQYLGDASVGNLQYPTDVARPSSRVCQLHDLLSRGVWQRPAIDVHSSQLVDAAVASRGTPKQGSTTHRR